MAREKTNTIHPIKAVDVALKLTGTMQNYAWGHDSYIADLQGRDPSGDPEAELWFGAHPAAPATVGGTGLDEIIAADPAAVGAPPEALTPEGWLRILPSFWPERGGLDGFFAARLERIA